MNKSIAVFFSFLVFAALLGSIASESQAGTLACAAINSDGTVAGGFRVNKDVLETRRLGVGNYEVDFTPVSTNIKGYSRSAVLDTQGTGTITGQIGVADRAGDASSVFVLTTDSAGAAADLSFDLCIHSRK